MWNFLKSLISSKKDGGIVTSPVENETYSSDWDWQLYVVEFKNNISGFIVPNKHKPLEPTGGWLIETKYNGTQTLYVEAIYKGEVRMYSEQLLKIIPKPKSVYIKNGQIVPIVKTKTVTIERLLS